MARDGRFLVAGALCALAFAALSAAAQERDQPITATLAVQAALQQGRELILRGNNAQAVLVLEKEIARINGNRDYLSVLRDAYRAHVKDLRLARKDAEADDYLRRLKVLDPAAASDPAIAHALPAGAGAKPEAVPVTARGKSDEQPRPESPRPESPRPATPSASPLPPSPAGTLDRAEREFAAKNYDAAGKLYSQASQAGESLGTETRERWAYCKLHGVVAVLNQGPGGTVAPELEGEVRLALALAPKLQEYGKELLNKIRERTEPAPSPSPAPTAAAVKHLENPIDGWDVAETANLRVFHHKQVQVAEKAAQIAEATRVSMTMKWIGDLGPEWAPRCDVYLHATAQDYSRATGVPANSPGHSTLRTEGGRVTGRRIDLHCDDVNMLTAVLPHEATHIVLAGRLGDGPVPRWVDEGIAVLSEPREKVERHLRNLPQYGRDGTLLGLREIMQMNDYPNPRFISAFYAQSVSVVDFLSREKGPLVFGTFVKEGLTGGYEAALKKHYGIQGFDELEQKWKRHALGGGTESASKR